MYNRFLRYLDAAPAGRPRLSPRDYAQYDAWSKNASAAYKEYRAGAMTADEFLQRIDTTHELESYDTGQVRPAEAEETLWQRLVARGWDFDPDRFFPEAMLILNLSKPDAQWELRTADELRRRTQKGHQSLREKYGKA